MKKCLPRFSAFLIQLFSLHMSLLLLVPFCLYLKGFALILSTCVFFFLWITDLLTFVLSLTVWWNVPLVINHNGISIKGKNSHSWFDAVNFTGNGQGTYNIHVRYKIEFSDGSIIVFEPNHNILQTIRSFCNNPVFLDMLNCYLEEHNIEL